MTSCDEGGQEADVESKGQREKAGTCSYVSSFRDTISLSQNSDAYRNVFVIYTSRTTEVK